MRCSVSIEKYGVIRELHQYDYIMREGSVLTPEDYIYLQEIFLRKYPLVLSENLYKVNFGNTSLRLFKPDKKLLEVCKVEDFSATVKSLLSEKKYQGGKSFKIVIKETLDQIKLNESVVILVPLNYDLNKWLTGKAVITRNSKGIHAQTDIFIDQENFFSQKVFEEINNILERYPQLQITYGGVKTISEDETGIFANLRFAQEVTWALDPSNHNVKPTTQDVSVSLPCYNPKDFKYDQVSLNGEIEDSNPFLLLLPLVSHVENQYAIFQRLRSFLQLTEQTELLVELKSAFAFIQKFQMAEFIQESEVKQWSLENFAYKKLTSYERGNLVQVKGNGFEIFINMVEQILNITGRQEAAEEFKKKHNSVHKDWYLRAENWPLMSQLAIIENVEKAKSTIELDNSLIRQHGYYDLAAIFDSVSMLMKVRSFVKVKPESQSYPINYAIINDSVKTLEAFLEADPLLISQTNAQGNIMHLVMGSVFINGDSRFKILNFLILNHPEAVKEMLKAKNQFGKRPLDMTLGVNSLYALKIIMNRVRLGIDLDNPEDFLIFEHIKDLEALTGHKKLTCLYYYYFKSAPTLSGSFNLSEAIDREKLSHIWNWLNSRSFDPDLQEQGAPSLLLVLFNKVNKDQLSEWLQLFVDHGIGLNYEESPACAFDIKKPTSVLYFTLSKGLLLETEILVNAGVVFNTEHLSWLPDAHPEMSKFVKLQSGQKVNPGYELLQKILDRGDKPLAEVLTNEYVSSLYPKSYQIEELNAIKEALFITKGSGRKKKKVLNSDLTILQILQIIPVSFPGSLSIFNLDKELIIDRLFYCSRNGYIKELFYLLRNYPEIPKEIRMTNSNEFLLENVIKNYAFTNSNATKVIDLLISYNFSLKTSASNPLLKQQKLDKHKLLNDLYIEPIMKLAAEKGLKDIIDILHLRGICFTESAYKLIPESLKANFKDHKERIDNDMGLNASLIQERIKAAEDEALKLIEAEDKMRESSNKSRSKAKKTKTKGEKNKASLIEIDDKEGSKDDVLNQDTFESEVSKDKVIESIDAIKIASIEDSEDPEKDQGEWVKAHKPKRNKTPNLNKQINKNKTKTSDLSNFHSQQSRLNLKIEPDGKERAANQNRLKKLVSEEIMKPENKSQKPPPAQTALVSDPQNNTDVNPQLRPQKELSKDDRIITDLQIQKILELEVHIFKKFDKVVMDEDNNTISLFSANAALKTAFVTGLSNYKFSFCEFIEQNKLHANLQEFRAAIRSFVESHDKPLEEFEQMFKGLYEMSVRMAVHLEHSKKRDFGSGI